MNNGIKDEKSRFRTGRRGFLKTGLLAGAAGVFPKKTRGGNPPRRMIGEDDPSNIKIGMRIDARTDH